MDMKVDFPGGKKVSVGFKGFSVATDQPIDEGGENTAPSPFDLFLVSLGACAGVYAQSFCRERKLNMEGLGLCLSFDQDEKTHMVKKVVIQIQLPVDFPEKYHSAITRTVGLCTVKKHLMNPPEFDIGVVGK